MPTTSVERKMCLVTGVVAAYLLLFRLPSPAVRGLFVQTKPSSSHIMVEPVAAVLLHVVSASHNNDDTRDRGGVRRRANKAEPSQP